MAMDENEEVTGTLGIERWVQFAFIGAALTLFWLLDYFLAGVATFVARKANYAEPPETLVTAGAAIVSILVAVSLYKNEKINRFAHEVAFELANVTWPTRKETWSQTVVVMIVSAIAAVILGIFDATWSAVTDLIY